MGQFNNGGLRSISCNASVSELVSVNASVGALVSESMSVSKVTLTVRQRRRPTETDRVCNQQR